MPQISVILCQFCDVHGPAVTFCSRATDLAQEMSALIALEAPESAERTIPEEAEETESTHAPIASSLSTVVAESQSLTRSSKRTMIESLPSSAARNYANQHNHQNQHNQQSHHKSHRPPYFPCCHGPADTQHITITTRSPDPTTKTNKHNQSTTAEPGRKQRPATRNRHSRTLQDNEIHTNGTHASSSAVSIPIPAAHRSTPQLIPTQSSAKQGSMLSPPLPSLPPNATGNHPIASWVSETGASYASKQNSPHGQEAYLNLEYLRENDGDVVDENRDTADERMNESTESFAEDFSEQKMYITTRQPPKDLVFRCRNACIKSLSIEAASERVEPMIFCDGGMACFSYAFRLKDQQARGFHRWYSLVCIIDDFTALLWAWTFLTESFKKMAAELQQSAEAVFMKEGKTQLPSFGRITGRSPMLPPPNAPRRPAPTQRILEEVLGIHNLIGVFHVWTTILFHNMEHRYISLHMERISQNVYGYLHKCDYPDLIRPPEIYGENVHDVSAIHHVARLLGEDYFRLVVYNMLIGNQVIVRGDHEYMVSRISRMLQTLLPENCVKAIENSLEYRQSYECNILSLLSNNHVIPPEVDPKSYVLIDVTRRSDNSTMTRTRDLSAYPSISHYAFLRFRVYAKVFKYTSLGARYEKVWSAKHDPNFETVFIEQLKAEWASKAKLFAVFARMPGSEREERIRQFSRSLRLHDEDLNVLKFWATGLRAHKITFPFSTKIE